MLKVYIMYDINIVHTYLYLLTFAQEDSEGPQSEGWLIKVHRQRKGG